MLSSEHFYDIRNRYLTSATPIQSPEHLKGRDRSLKSLVDALHTPGRHAFIYGYRGVGKSSLAHTTALQIQSSSGSPIFVSCDPNSTFESLIRDIARRSRKPIDERLHKPGKLNVGVNVASIGGANIGYESKSPASDPPEVKSVNEALDYLLLAASPHKKGIVIVVDEFDRLQYDSCHSKFATLVKQISDQAAPIKFIFCGISGSVEALFREHESVFRSIHSELVERLALNARLEIIDDASGALQIGIPDGFKYRIAQISDGFPSFVHLLADKMFSAAFEANKDRVDSLIYKTGLQVALRSVEFSLKKRYEDALHKNTKKYEHVIWSVASDHNLDSNVETIWKNYISIMETIGENSLARQNVNTKLNQLTTESYGRLLVKPRRSNYSFDEKMMRGYARLRAEDSGCSLGKENADLVRM